MALFKKMFTTKPVDEQQNVPQQQSNKMSYKAWGHKCAGDVNGSSHALQPCLQSVYVNIRKAIEKDDDVQNRRKTEIQMDIADLEAKKDEINTYLKYEQEKLTNEETKIEKTKKEIEDVRRNPQKITGDKFVKVSFWIGAVIISLLTIYLFVFYSSAAFSAFFKDFTLLIQNGDIDDINIANSIFDSQALSKAFNEGTSELILILTIPAVFLGLGFLIHKFQEQKKNASYFKIAGLMAITFVFDAILAYEIVEKIYNAQNEIILGRVMTPMTVALAVKQINFWLIIFAGFVVYLIWGFVFTFVMDEYEKLDKVRYSIKISEQNIKDYKEECKDIKSKIKDLEIHKNTVEGSINKLKQKLSGVIIYFNDVKESINDFFTGWISYMKGTDRPQTEISTCTEIKDAFIASLQNNFTPVE
ncbi:MAG: hypothetical protein LBH30_08025 [Prevotellaceae bacterium]|jgi:peptidoglycan hydrolase CwlO-like protein|nr:hypothetical protein [Prevotellaceae bacterium]